MFISSFTGGANGTFPGSLPELVSARAHSAHLAVPASKRSVNESRRHRNVGYMRTQRFTKQFIWDAYFYPGGGTGEGEILRKFGGSRKF